MQSVTCKMKPHKLLRDRCDVTYHMQSVTQVDILHMSHVTLYMQSVTYDKMEKSHVHRLHIRYMYACMQSATNKMENSHVAT